MLIVEVTVSEVEVGLVKGRLEGRGRLGRVCLGRVTLGRRGSGWKREERRGRRGGNGGGRRASVFSTTRHSIL